MQSEEYTLIYERTQVPTGCIIMLLNQIYYEYLKIIGLPEIL